MTLPHYLWKITVQICDTLRTKSTFKLSRSVMVSVGNLKLGLRPDPCQSGSEDQRQLLSRRDRVAAAVARDVRRIRRFLRLSTRQRTRTLGT